MSKGSTQRPTNKGLYDKNYERIFNKFDPVEKQSWQKQKPEHKRTEQ